MTPIVSVIVPVYNAEKYLERCVSSLVNQTLKDLEIILVDDGSKDSSGTLCDQLASQDNRIKVVHCVNSGVSKARNIGIAQATGQYVSFVDSDDWLDLQAYELLVKSAVGNKTGVVYGDYAEVYTDRTYNKSSFPLGRNWVETVTNMLNFGPHGGNPWNFLLVKKEFLENSHLEFPPYLKRGEDFWFTLHVQVLSHAISKVNKVLYYYDLSNTESATHNEIIDKTPNYLLFIDECIAFLKENNCYSQFCTPLNQRILLEKTIWAVHPSCFHAYRTIHPEVNCLVDDNPFIFGNMKRLLYMLNGGHYVIASLMIAAFRLKKIFMR